MYFCYLDVKMFFACFFFMCFLGYITKAKKQKNRLGKIHSLKANKYTNINPRKTIFSYKYIIYKKTERQVLASSSLKRQ